MGNLFGVNTEEFLLLKVGESKIEKLILGKEKHRRANTYYMPEN